MTFPTDCIHVKELWVALTFCFTKWEMYNLDLFLGENQQIFKTTFYLLLVISDAINKFILIYSNYELKQVAIWGLHFWKNIFFKKLCTFFVVVQKLLRRERGIHLHKNDFLMWNSVLISLMDRHNSWLFHK